MIKRINKIKNFGVFKDFKWDSDKIPDFNKHNLFYGWNYSGKTTISRLFRCFELGEKHQDYPSAEFELEDDQNPSKKFTDKDLSTLPHVRVFNTDFILKNLKWHSQDDEGIEPIFFSIGKENIELQEKLEKLQTEQKTLNDEKTKLSDKKTELENDLGNKLTNEARDITKTLSLGRNYEKPQFKQDVDSIKNDFAKYILNDDDYGKYLTTYKSTEQKDDIILSTLPALNFSDLQKKTKEIVERKITAQKIIEELKNNENLNKWVNEGRGLHKSKNKCSFCGNDLPTDLFQKLDQHFSTEYEQLEKDLQSLLTSLENHKTAVDGIVLPAKGDFYKEFVSEYEKINKEFKNLIKKYCENIEELSNRLKSKKAKPFDKHNFIDISDNVADIKSKFDEIKSVVEKQKNKTENFEKEKNEAKEKLIKHFSAQFIQDQKYLDILKGQNEIAERITANTTNIDKIAKDILGVEQQLSESTKGAEKVNEYIQQFFQHDGIKIIPENNRFKMSRNNEPAKNLSEGEKTAISLAYFIASLEDKKTKLNETIVFIDDPVSSLDCNHLFNIYAFIKSKLINCSQLFVSTHNLEFFNLMKDFLMEIKDQNDKNLYCRKELPCYLVQKQWNESINQSIILDLPKELKNFKSEYIYLFSIMLAFDKEKNGADFKMLYLLPNVERRFLEGYLGLRYPDGKPWTEKFERLVKDETQRNLVYKFVNEFSHNQTATRSLRFPEVSECKQSIDIVVDGLKTNDKDHYDALCVSCN
jgi:wobble nucleotide-excising tRNase